jgi:flagellar L-ring protein precursor FlgH
LKTETLAAVLLLPLAFAAAPSVSAQSTGGLVDPATFRGPAADSRAHRVGDLLTVHVLETTRARSQAVTGTERGTGIGASLHSPSADFDADLDIGGHGRGAGETTRIGELRAQITVRVTEVEPNGVMHIQGQTSLRVNAEDQRIEVTGIVRPEDITAENVVPSYRIAYAQVSLAGKGVVSESQRRSILMRVMHWLGL